MRTRDYKENSKLVTLLSPDRGKISALVKGVNKPKSKMQSVIQPFVYGWFQLYAGRSLHTITQGRVYNHFSLLRTELNILYNGYYILETLEKIAIEEENKGLFVLGLSSLHLLEALDDYKVVVPFFQIKALKNMGLTPHIDGCMNGHTLSENKVYFDLTEGGIVCKNCANYSENIIKLSKGTYRVLLFLLKAYPAKLKKIKLSLTQFQELCLLHNNFLEIQLGIKIKSKKFLV